MSRLVAWWERRRRFLRSSEIDFDNLTLSCTDEYCNGETRKFEVKWADVQSVIAYKRDCFGYDLICFDFYTEDLVLTLNDEMVGWRALIHTLPSYLPGTPPHTEWWDKIVHPPFAPCVTKLFDRASQTSPV